MGVSVGQFALCPPLCATCTFPLRFPNGVSLPSAALPTAQVLSSTFVIERHLFAQVRPYDRGSKLNILTFYKCISDPSSSLQRRKVLALIAKPSIVVQTPPLAAL